MVLCVLLLFVHSVASQTWVQQPWRIGMSPTEALSSFQKAKWTHGENLIKIVKNPLGNDAVMQMTYLKNTRLPAQFFTDSPLAKDVIFSYEVMFENGFEWVKGGKLPGLYGNRKGCSGGMDATAQDCFSTRYMWFTGGSGFVYYYGHKDRTCQGVFKCSDTKYGNAIGNLRFETGKWTEIKQRVKLNTGSNKDGILTVWINGKEIFNINFMKYYGNSDGRFINGIFFETFFGGGDDTYNSPKDQKAYFRNFKYQILQAGSVVG